MAAPPMTGAEYLTAEILHTLWREMDAAFAIELAESGSSIQDFLKRRNPAWNLVGRVHFNLAENRRDDQAPFAFLATYTTRLSAHAKAQHLPLGQALREYAGATSKERLLVAAPARSARGGNLPVAESHGRLGRDLPSAALETERRFPLSPGCSPTGERRRGGADARDVAGKPSFAPASKGHGGREGALRAGHRTRCSISAWKSRLTASL